MRREILLLDEIVEAAEQAHRLVDGVALEALAKDRVLRDALLWNFTVMGEAAAQLPDKFKDQHPQVPWRQPVKTHVTAILTKLGARDRTQAVVIAYESGFVEHVDPTSQRPL